MKKFLNIVLLVLCVLSVFGLGKAIALNHTPLTLFFLYIAHFTFSEAME